jgi:hypothetical protein
MICPTFMLIFGSIFEILSGQNLANKRVQVTLNQLKAPLRQNQISYEQLLPLTTDIIKKQCQEHRNQRSKLTGKLPPSPIKLPEFHTSFEVIGLLRIHLQGFLKPSFFHSPHQLTQKDIFVGQDLALKVLLQPESHFGVQVEHFRFYITIHQSS